MRLFSTKSRAAAEILLTVAVLAFVTYDLVGRGGEKASSSEPASLSFQGKSGVELPSVAPAAESAAAAAPARFESQVDPTISTNATFAICNQVLAPTNPWIIGQAVEGFVKQAIVFYGNSQCTSNPTVLSPNVSTGFFATIVVKPGSWLSLQNVVVPRLPGVIAQLYMEPGSNLEAVIPTGFTANPYIIQNFTLLTINGVCPSFIGVNRVVTNCPTVVGLDVTGGYTCFLTAIPSGQQCSIGLVIVGALSSQSNSYIQVTMNKDCSTLTQVVFKATIAGATHVSPLALLVTYWQCSSIVSIFGALGATQGLANAALTTIFTSMQSGALRALLAITNVRIVLWPFPTAFTVTSTYAAPYYPLVPFPVLVSSSNPALFALLSLLVIPIAFVITMCVWVAYRRRSMPLPDCCPCPAPCPAPMPMPMCVPITCPAPCDPCSATMITPSSTPFVGTMPTF